MEKKTTSAADPCAADPCRLTPSLTGKSTRGTCFVILERGQISFGRLGNTIIADSLSSWFHAATSQAWSAITVKSRMTIHFRREVSNTSELDCVMQHLKMKIASYYVALLLSKQLLCSLQWTVWQQIAPPPANELCSHVASYINTVY